jgi:hypothetical protein
VRLWFLLALLLEEIEVKFLKVAQVLALISSASVAQTASTSYSFLFDDNKNIWCGYTNEREFQEISRQIQPLESAHVIYKAETLFKITYQVQPESGDWIMIDQYSILPKQISLRRAFVFAHSGVQVVKEGRIIKGRPNRLSLVIASNPDGSRASVKNIDFPPVAVNDDPSEFIFIKIAESMKNKSLQTLCMQPELR